MKLINNKLISTHGGKLQRKSDGIIFGGSVSLGYIYQLNGQILDTPHKETIDDYQEVKALNFKEKLYQIPTTFTYGDLVDFLIRTKYNMSEEFAILRQKDSKEDKFNEYNSFCELCKITAKEFLGI